MKYKTIGGFKNVQNVPYCKADKDMAVGMGVILSRKENAAKLVANETDAKACHYIVTNIDVKPESASYADAAKVLKGEYVRADDLFTVMGMEIEFADFEVTEGLDSVNVGDKLVFGNDGKLKKDAGGTAQGYTVCFEVIAKTAYMGKGVLAVVSEGAPAAE